MSKPGRKRLQSAEKKIAVQVYVPTAVADDVYRTAQRRGITIHVLTERFYRRWLELNNLRNTTKAKTEALSA